MKTLIILKFLKNSDLIIKELNIESPQNYIEYLLMKRNYLI